MNALRLNTKIAILIGILLAATVGMSFYTASLMRSLYGQINHFVTRSAPQRTVSRCRSPSRSRHSPPATSSRGMARRRGQEKRNSAVAGRSAVFSSGRR